MKGLYKQIKYSLNNEEGNVHVETLIGVVVALVVGAGVYDVYRRTKYALEGIGPNSSVTVRG